MWTPFSHEQHILLKNQMIDKTYQCIFFVTFWYKVTTKK